MEDISTDPIIIFYITLSGESEYKKPQFSEMRLRLAFTRVLGSLYVVSKCELELYKKLLVLNYARKNEFESLQEIMICFDMETIKEILEKEQEITNEWRKYTEIKLIEVVYLDATLEILKEWHHRLQQHPELQFNLNLVVQQTVKIFTFLNCCAENRSKFIKKTYGFLSHASTSRPAKAGESSSLNLSDIYEFVKPKLNSFVVQSTERHRSKLNTQYGLDDDTTNLEEAELVELIDIDDGKCIKLKKIKPTAKRRRYTTRMNKVIIEVEEPATTVLRYSDDYCEDNNPTIYSGNEESLTLLETDNLAETIQQRPEPTTPCLEILNEDVLSEAKEDYSVDKNISSDTSEYFRSTDIIDRDTAQTYLDSLKMYALANESFEALDLLEQVQHIFS